MKIFISFFISLLFVLNTFSQNYTVELLDEQKTTSRGAVFIGMDQNGYVYAHSFRSFYVVFSLIQHAYIKVYDSKDGSIIAEKRIDLNSDLSKLGYSILSFMLNDNKPVFLCKKRGRTEDNDYYLVDLDERLNLIGEPYKVGYNAECKTFFKANAANIYFSEDPESKLTLSITDKSCKTDGVVSLYGILRDKDNNIIHEFPVVLEMPRINQLNATIYDENKYYLNILSLDRKKEEGKLFKTTERSNILASLDKNGEMKEIDLDILGPGVFVGAFRIIKSQGKLLFSGQIMDENTFKFTGVFTGIINPETDEITDLNKQYFESEFVERFWTDRQSKKSERRQEKGKDQGDGFNGTYKLIDYFPTDDGGIVSFYQKYWVDVVTTTRRDANGMVYNQIDYYYNYSDMIPVKTNKNGAIEWVEMIPIRQETVNYDPGTSFLATQKGEDVFIFYNSSNEQDKMLEEEKVATKRQKMRDKIQRNATIAKISTNGKLSFETVIDMREERGVYFDPGTMGVDEVNNRIIMINNTRSKKTRLVVISY